MGRLCFPSAALLVTAVMVRVTEQASDLPSVLSNTYRVAVLTGSATSSHQFGVGGCDLGIIIATVSW